MTFDRCLDIVRREEFGLRQVEALYRKEAVCEPGCTHSQSELYCSRRYVAATIGGGRWGRGSDEGEGA